MNNSTIIIFVLLIIGFIFIVIGIIRNQQMCTREKIIYRYIPRTFDEEQNEPVYASDVFRTMFSQSSPWIISVNEIDNKKYDEINRFFISQV